MRAAALCVGRVLNWPIRQRLIASFLIILIPLLALNYLTVQDNVAYAKRLALADNLETASVIRASIENLLMDTENILLTLSNSPVVRARDSVESSRMFTQLLQLTPDLANIVGARENGTIFAMAVPADEESANIPESEYFQYVKYSQHVMRTGKPAVSLGLIYEPTSDPVVAYAVPIFDYSGELAGAVCASLSLGRVQRSLPGLDTGGHASVIVVNSYGLPLLRSGDAWLAEARDLSGLTPVQEVLSGQKGGIEYRNPYDGEMWLAAYEPIGGTGWGVIVSRPAGTAYPSVSDILIRGILSIIVTAALAAAIGVFFAKWVSQPLQELTTAARAISCGDLGTQVDTRTPAEFKDLAQSFNTMSKRLVSTMDSLRKSHEELERKAWQLQRLFNRTLNIQETERQRIALDLHDGAAQLVVGCLFHIRAGRQFLASRPELAAENMETAQRLLGEATGEIRRAVFDLHPPSIEEMGLVPSLQRHVEGWRSSFDLPCTFEVDGHPARLAPATEMVIYRIVQESLSNVVKHAEASRAWVRLAFSQSDISVIVGDDGKGFDMESTLNECGEHLGLVGIKERVQSIGGVLDLRSVPGEGTLIEFRVPLAVEVDFEEAEADISDTMAPQH